MASNTRIPIRQQLVKAIDYGPLGVPEPREMVMGKGEHSV